MTRSTNAVTVGLDPAPALSVQVTLQATPATHGAAVVTSTISVSNTGNQRTPATVLSSLQWTGFSCTGSGINSIASLDPGATISCTASFAFDQNTYEGAVASASPFDTGSLETSITATATGPNAPAAASATVTIPTSYTAATAVSIDSCTMPATAGKLQKPPWGLCSPCPTSSSVHPDGVVCSIWDSGMSWYSANVCHRCLCDCTCSWHHRLRGVCPQHGHCGALQRCSCKHEQHHHRLHPKHSCGAGSQCHHVLCGAQGSAANRL